MYTDLVQLGQVPVELGSLLLDGLQGTVEMGSSLNSVGMGPWEEYSDILKVCK